VLFISSGVVKKATAINTQATKFIKKPITTMINKVPIKYQKPPVL
jgi:hypothetical protein